MLSAEQRARILERARVAVNDAEKTRGRVAAVHELVHRQRDAVRANAKAFRRLEGRARPQGADES